MIVNRKENHDYWCLWTSGHVEKKIKTYRPYFPQNWMDLIDIPNRKIYYVEFMGIDTFKIFNLESFVESDYIDRIRHGDVALMVHCTGHGYHEIAEEVYLNLIIRDKIPIDNIILSSESVDLHSAVVWAAHKHNLPVIRTRVAFEFEAYASHWINYDDDLINPTNLEYKQYDKKFVCLNGLYRDHRAAIVFALASYGLLDKGYVSYRIKDGGPNGNDAYENLVNRLRDCPELVNLLQRNEHQLRQIDSILLDTTFNQQERNLALPEIQHTEYFNNTYFTILTETNFPELRRSEFLHSPDILLNNVGRLYSEKIFRCIAFKHPFLATGPKGFLETLHWLGYKTFRPIIDESYDKEPDDAKRLYMIVQEAKRLCELEGNDLRNFLDKAREICEYNFNVLKSRRKFSFDLPIDTNLNVSLVDKFHNVKAPP